MRVWEGYRSGPCDRPFVELDPQGTPQIIADKIDYVKRRVMVGLLSLIDILRMLKMLFS